ncbi:hypothetical protein AB5I41_10750 [Sphingomonas sp. MMS24-JH45]
MRHGVRWSTCRCWRKRNGLMEKYADGEILAQCRRIAERYGLYDKALFHTEVTGVTWDEIARAG